MTEKNDNRVGLEIANSGRDRSPELITRSPRVLSKYTQAPKPSRVFEPRCKTCTHDYRDWIEMQIVRGASLRSLSMRVNPSITRESLANHKNKHMDLQDSVLREILEREAQLQGMTEEEGVHNILTARAALETMLVKGHQDILDNKSAVEAKDLIQVVRTLGQMDEGRQQDGLDQAKAQIQIFMQAIRNVLTPEQQSAISVEVNRIRSTDPSYSYRGSAEIAPHSEEIVDAEWIEEPVRLEDDANPESGE